MRTGIRLLVVVAIALGGNLPAWGDAPRKLEDAFTADEFRQSGLFRLTPQELRFLNERLALRALDKQLREPSAEPPAAPVVGAAAFGNEQLRKGSDGSRVPDSIRERIHGAFTGWTGRTLFTLANGQVWRQADTDRFAIRLDDPAVIIEKGSMGAYFLRVEGYGARVRVVRVR